MKKTAALLVLLGFLAYTGGYVFVYLFRAFRFAEPVRENTVFIWHGDPMIRAVLVAILFIMGLLMLLFFSLSGANFRREGSIRIRADLWEWVRGRADETNEAEERIVERAVASYRSHLERGVRTG